MSKKILITEKQAMQFNLMLHKLKVISKEYSTPDQIRKECKGEWRWVDYSEALEMAYENIQNDAKYACKGVKIINVLNKLCF